MYDVIYRAYKSICQRGGGDSSLQHYWHYLLYLSSAGHGVAQLVWWDCCSRLSLFFSKWVVNSYCDPCLFTWMSHTGFLCSVWYWIMYREYSGSLAWAFPMWLQFDWLSLSVPHSFVCFPLTIHPAPCCSWLFAVLPPPLQPPLFLVHY